MQLYFNSFGGYGDSPFIYPVYGLSGLAEAFSRLCALYFNQSSIFWSLVILITNFLGLLGWFKMQILLITFPIDLTFPNFWTLRRFSY